MPAVTFLEYARSVEEGANSAVATGHAQIVSLQVDQRSVIRGLISGSLRFDDGSTLHFCEFVDTGQAEPKMMYVYHYQDADNRLIFRYDNAAHRPALSRPAHRHSRTGIEIAAVPSLSSVLDQILQRDG